VPLFYICRPSLLPSGPPPSLPPSLPPPFATSPPSYLKSAGRADVEVVTEAGTDVLGDNATGLAAAVAAAGRADVVVLLVGYNNKDIEREGQDHDFTTLPGLQNNLTDAVVSDAAKR
jgi:beta-xylosidase